MGITLIIGRLIGWFFILLGLIALGVEILQSLEAGSWQPIALGQMWFQVEPVSLQQLQPFVQRYLLPQIWDPGIQTILLWPAWACLMGLGVILSLLFKKRKKRRKGLLR